MLVILFILILFTCLYLHENIYISDILSLDSQSAEDELVIPSFEDPLLRLSEIFVTQNFASVYIVQIQCLSANVWIGEYLTFSKSQLNFISSL